MSFIDPPQDVATRVIGVSVTSCIKMGATIMHRFANVTKNCGATKKVLPALIIPCLGRLGLRIDVHARIVQKELNCIRLSGTRRAHRFTRQSGIESFRYDLPSPVASLS